MLPCAVVGLVSFSSGSSSKLDSLSRVSARRYGPPVLSVSQLAIAVLTSLSLRLDFLRRSSARMCGGSGVPSCFRLKWAFSNLLMKSIALSVFFWRTFS